MTSERQGWSVIRVLRIAGLLFLALVCLLLLGVFQSHIRAILPPPPGAFPGSVGEVDGKLQLTWWGCMKLPSGDAREVGAGDERALFLMPGGRCEKAPPLPADDRRLFATWRRVFEEDNEPFGAIRLIVPGECPAEISAPAREGALRLLEEYLQRRTNADRYHADAVAAVEALKLLAGPTRPIREEDPGAINELKFYGGVWGPVRRPGTYPVCIPA